MGHSSASIAQPLSIRFPISAEAVSDCCLRRKISSVSIGGANVGELRVLETSVGGVEDRDKWPLDALLMDDWSLTCDCVVLGRMGRLEEAVDAGMTVSQLAQKN